jgi:energy-coupling factor transporter transmembrane protein EcfT
VAVILDRWKERDLWLAAALIGAVVLRTPDVLVYALLAVAAIWAVLRLLAAWLARSPGSLLVTVVVVGLLALIVPWIFESAITTRLAKLHDLTVDHRPRPGGEINADRIRFSGTASDLADEDFVVLFLGDSFTFGETLDYDDAYPYVFERIVSRFDCTARVRSVNAGWVSASPLLALRLLREIGPEYRPDLVVYALDMTDFHDDLRYERRLREGGDLEIDAGEAFVQLLVRGLPGLSAYGSRLRELRDAFRSRDEDGKEGQVPLPRDRFFATAQPLEESEADIERGVIRNLDQLHDFSMETLGAPVALVIYPRAYQYSMEESPRSWESHRYEAMGPWVREPFRYFREKGDRLPYPVLDTLFAFENADEFPLFREDDPHWNEAGARLMAETVARWTAESGLIPCRVPAD